MVQNFAHFQQYSHPGAGSCVFSEEAPVRRAEAACAICARLDWKEHRLKLNLFAKAPEEAHESDSENEHQEQEDAKQARPRIIRCAGIAYLKNPKKVQELLNVERYIERWPLIPLGNYTHRASSTLTIQPGDGCCTAAAYRCFPTAALLSLLQSLPGSPLVLALAILRCPYGLVRNALRIYVAITRLCHYTASQMTIGSVARR